MSKLVPASKAAPCPVCHGDHKCSTTADGELILCGRTTGPVPGFDHLGPCKDENWHKFKVSAGERRGVSPPVVPPRATGGLTPRRSPDEPHVAFEDFARHLSDARAVELAARLRLPKSALARMPGIGFHPGTGTWTFPEYDATNAVVGVLCRYADGTKRMIPGSRRGLSMCGGWADHPGPLFVVEGPSDVLAMAACGLPALGRPSNVGGGDELVGLLRGHRPDRPVVVVGENDEKPDGLWPGKDGAKKVATELATRLNRDVSVSLPPAGYKDVREWVVDMHCGAADGFDWNELGRSISRDLTAAAVVVHPPATPRGDVTASFHGITLANKKYPLPTPVTDLELPGEGGVAWVWDGFLARDAVTLLSALPKCGKTTLLSHLLAALPAGGSFCGRPLSAGRAVVVSEEPAGVWASRRDDLGLTCGIRVVSRGAMARCCGIDDWTGFIAHLSNLLAGDPADVVVFDTLANLWPVKDENSAAEVSAALSPLHRLTQGRCVLLVHHLRKSDGAEGTGSRGSGALAGFVDVMLELRRMKASTDPTQRKRVLSGYGRYDAIPAEWVIELRNEECGMRNEDQDPDGSGRDTAFRIPGSAIRPRFAHVPDKPTKGGTRDDELRQGIRGDLLGHPGGRTRKQIWDALPDELRRNEKLFREVIEDGRGQWVKEDRSNRDGGPVYRVAG